jgi:coenzyme F420 hydrogenase subunit beta
MGRKSAGNSGEGGSVSQAAGILTEQDGRKAMKTFFDLVQQVQKPGLCHRCGGCVTFCTAINFGALGQDEDGKPVFADMEKCIECGICYMICPEIDELDKEAAELVKWELPMGRMLETTVVRCADPLVRARATDGGAVTALLLHLFDTGRIDGAIVTRQTGLFVREPWLATTRREIAEAAGFFFDSSHGMSMYSEKYSTFAPSVQALGPLARRKSGKGRIAFVGTPCQIKTIRKMETLHIVPTDAIRYVFGLFCSGNFSFGAKERERLEKLGKFEWSWVRKINVKDHLMIHLDNGDIRAIPLEELDFMKRFACRFCDDYSAEYADVSFGGIGAEEGWTTVVSRSPLGRACLAHARDEGAIEVYASQDNPKFASEATQIIVEHSQKKRQKAADFRKTLEKTPPVSIKS